MGDREFMSVALRHARLGAGKVNPNPLVGAVIVRDGRIIAKGHHDHFGGWHAERAALEAAAAAGVDVRGATVYVTLEPCCHTGKQPPCSQALIDAGIARVVVGSPDPNPLVAGKGIRQLADAGIAVTEGVLRSECDALNEIFLHAIVTRTPFVMLKYAMTLDGHIATASGLSQWITGEAARRRVHEDRSRFASILVGVNTVLADDPQLTSRIEHGHDPLRVICDTHLRTPLDAQVVTTATRTPTIIATASADDARVQQYRDRGCEVLRVAADDDGHVSIAAVAAALYARGIDSIMIEGGSGIAWSALNAGIVTKVSAYIAPKLFGGTGAPAPIGGLGVASPDDCFRIAHPAVSAIGDDILIEGGVDYVHRHR
ncbi:bifunctional diaminohydroxyphosphoribosylaminopyrimidine deaminase/5-amino-6-(5-phosphoribosylamino)uracil reductase RibD [Bifidobacterium avesanii]|uniref:Riboflavin biosynthesis protein RibD n=1 Tax=Bifidobacterium avesanii TaxID=1798157 RepID=A0A7K3TGA8_9BIFI|nr:bifunctional diaminohydroxyphosphoribosylaminopyrimidine deaminase/5-amino-6-(5-phosphoribosylamino)uracil reductase RibD [Bifidobacterium avesanii]KAB8295645.1 bifunctional diaminohydroxyphosphoribosylaminopyrimidine deaminase/5-amino-6-(5-phosphoribosylamino)uracil reductase [Bifidobacterium avesanii]NEG77650.1 bifunctional diaminohydroxyphosphoribosylaminopyrimidine deaminase/5-amino-6-(5-phosphoribosylamino)uracil reductase RibD [Bifidobacterium avesanii]